MSNSLNQLIKKKFNTIKKKNFLSDKSVSGGDIDILDSNFKIRNSFLNNKKFIQSIINVRHHRTGTRYDLINDNRNLICLDFLNGEKKNPLFYNLSNVEGKKVDTKEINIKFTDYFTIMINLIKYFFCFVKKNFKQTPCIIEIFGIDEVEKSYLAKKTYKKICKTANTSFVNLWGIKKKKNFLKLVIPFENKAHSLPISLIKEIYILIRFIILILNIYIFSNRKHIYIFESSIYDVVIDPSKYRISYNPFFIKSLYNLFFANSIKLYLNSSFKLSKKRKNKVDKIKYFFLKNKLDYLFKFKFKNSIKLFE